MALNTMKCNHLTPLGLKRLTISAYSIIVAVHNTLKTPFVSQQIQQVAFEAVDQNAPTV